MTSSDELAPRLKCPFEGCTSVFSKYIPFKKHKRSHVNLNKKPEHKCNVCNAVFNRPWRLERHFRSHTGERPFKCNVEGCSKSYTNQCHLKRHKKVTHEKNFPIQKEEFLCGELNCGKVFETKFGLKRHIVRNHSQQAKVYACKECNIQFKKRNKLQAHMGIHGQKKVDEYRCPQCTLSFSTQVMLSKHLKNHRIYTCDCDETFQRWSDICSHRKNNCALKEEHRCIICSKIFLTKHNLSQHTLTHVEESKQDGVFKCPYSECPRSYRYKKNLTFHIGFAHDKKFEKPSDVTKFVCHMERCGLYFKTMKTLTDHRRSVHLDLPKKKRKPKKDRQNKNTAIDLASSEATSRSTAPSENIDSQIEETTGKPQMLSSALFKKLINHDSRRTSDSKNGAIKVENRKPIASIGSGVLSRKNRANNLENLESSLISNDAVDESEVESDEALLLKADRALENINSILGSKESPLIIQPAVNSSDDQSKYFGNNSILETETNLIRESQIHFSTGSNEGKDSEDINLIFNEPNSLNIKFKPLKIVLKKLDLDRRKFARSCNENIDIGCISIEEEFLRKTIRPLKVVIERMQIEGSSKYDANTKQKPLNVGNNQKMECIFSNCSNESTASVCCTAKSDCGNNAVELTGNKGDEIIDHSDESLTSEVLNNFTDASKEDTDNIPRVNIISVQVLKPHIQDIKNCTTSGNTHFYEGCENAVLDIVENGTNLVNTDNDIPDLSRQRHIIELDSDIPQEQPIDYGSTLVEHPTIAAASLQATILESVFTDKYDDQSNNIGVPKLNESEDFINMIESPDTLEVGTITEDNIYIDFVYENALSILQGDSEIGAVHAVNVGPNLDKISEEESDNHVYIIQSSRTVEQAANITENIVERVLETISIDSEDTTELKNGLNSLEDVTKACNFGHNIEEIANFEESEDLVSVEPVSVDIESTNQHDVALDSIKDILKSLSPDNSIVEEALDKIKGILRLNDSVTSHSN